MPRFKMEASLKITNPADVDTLEVNFIERDVSPEDVVETEGDLFAILAKRVKAGQDLAKE